MSLLYCDSFGHYTNAEKDHKWDERDKSQSLAFSDISATFARFGIDQGMKMTRRNDWIAKVLPQRSRLIVGFGINITTGIDPFSNRIPLIEFHSPFGTLQCQLTIEENFALGVLRSSSVVLGASEGGIIVPNKYHFVEIDMEVANSADVEVRVDDEVVLTLTGVDTQNSSGADGIGRVVLSTDAGGVAFSNDNILLPGGRTSLANASLLMWDDVYICDTSGSVNNTFLGDVRVEPLWPSGAGDYAQFDVSGAAANWQAVDEVTPDDETTTVETTVLKEIDLHEFEDSGGADGAVKAIAVNLWGRQVTTGGFSSVVAALKTGGSVYYGASAFLMGVELWNCYQYAFETNPDTVAAWTISDLNALQAGYKRQS